MVKCIISCLHTDRAAPKAFFGLAIVSEKSRKGSCGLENTKTSSFKINCSEGQDFVEKKYQAMNISHKQVEDNQSDQGPVSETRLSENSEYAKPEMRETLGFPFQNGRFVKPGKAE